MKRKIHSAGAAHAASLVGAGKITDSDSWTPPTAEQENAYLSSHSLADFGSWHLGIDQDEDKETKGRWSYAFTSDFQKVNYAGLRACITRAAQAGHTDIEKRARSLYEKAKKKLGKEDKKSDRCEILVFNEGEASEIVISGTIGSSWDDSTGTTEKDFRQKFGIVPPGKKVRVRISSEGGAVGDALAIYNLLRERGDTVTTIVDGYALSSASIIALGGHRVVVPASSIMMIHEPWSMTVGDEEDHLKSAEMLAKHGDTLAQIYARKTGKTADEMRELMRAESWYNGLDALRVGLADATAETMECPGCGHDKCGSCEVDGDEITCSECGETHTATEWEEAEESELHSQFASHFAALNIAPFKNIPPHILNLLRPQAIPLPRQEPPLRLPVAAAPLPTKEIMNKKQILDLLKKHGVELAEDTPEDKILEALAKLTDKPAPATPPEDAATMQALRTQLESERKIRITGEVKRRAENKVENKQLDWWIKLAMQDEAGTLAQLDALPIVRPGGEPIGMSISVVENRLEEIRKEPSARKRYDLLRGQYDGLMRDALTRDMRMNLAVSSPSISNQNAQRLYPVAANTYSSSLVTQFLLDGAVTKLQNRWAALKVFSKDYSQDRYKPRATGQLKFVTSGGTTQKNATNFESGDAIVSNVQIAVDQYTTAFHVTNDELNSGLRMENLVDIKVAECADNILKVAFSPLATGSFTTNPAIIRAAPSFNFSDMATAWGELKKSPIKYAVLDGEYMARIINQPVFYQVTGTESGGEDGWRRFGWDGVYLNTNWSGHHSGAADQYIRGLFCNPQVMGAIAGLPLSPPAIPGATLQESTITVPDVDISIAAYSWFSLSSRTFWMSYDLMFGSALLDESAGVLMTSQ